MQMNFEDSSQHQQQSSSSEIQLSESSSPCSYNLLDLFLEVVHDSEDSNSINSDCDGLLSMKNSSIIESYSKVKKSNIVKNILKSFQRYIEEANKDEQEQLCAIIKKAYCFSQLKKLIKRNFKTFGKRWNMKLKYLVDKCSYKGLFEYYLQYKSNEWLEQSKVQNKDDHKVVIDFLLQALQKPEYRNEIKYYKKIKSITQEE